MKFITENPVYYGVFGFYVTFKYFLIILIFLYLISLGDVAYTAKVRLNPPHLKNTGCRTTCILQLRFKRELHIVFTKRIENWSLKIELDSPIYCPTKQITGI